MKKTIAIASDHNGVLMKAKVNKFLVHKNYEYLDLGPMSSVPSVDYVDFAFLVAQKVSSFEVDFGVLICGTGIGMSIAANKLPNIRAALVHNELSAKNSKIHNNSNIICLGSWINEDEMNIHLLDLWLNTNFENGRHVIRIEKLKKLENKMML